MYVAVKGGEKAITNAHTLLGEKRRGNPDTPELTISQIKEQMALAVDRVMTEGSVYDRDLAALAIKQAQGDLVEAIFLLRAYRVRRHINWNNLRPDLKEDLVHLVQDIKRRICGIASAGIPSFSV